MNLAICATISSTLTASGSWLSFGSSSAPTDPAEVIGTRAVDVDGQVHQLGGSTSIRPVALVFVDPDCPVSRRLAPTYGRLAALAAESNVGFFGVVASPTVLASEVRSHRTEYHLEFPILFDSSGALARALTPTHVPEAFVISGDDGLAYRGRINDLFVAPGKTRNVVTSHEFQDAILAVANGQPAPSARTEPVGCVFEPWDDPTQHRSVTYHRDIAPLLEAHCVECHRKGDIAPFALTDYASTKRKARTMARAVESGFMPPWHAARGSQRFRNERHLTDAQIQLFQDWVDAGAPEGSRESALPPNRRPEGRWRLGEPDLLIQMEQPFDVPAEGSDIYRYFVVRGDLLDGQLVNATDFRPGDPAVVHHCIAYVDPKGKARELEAKDDRPGFQVFGNNAAQKFGWTPIAGWAPGSLPNRLPPGVAIEMPKGGDVVLEIHYHLTGKSTEDRSALALYFADQPVETLAHGLEMGTLDVKIPAGEAGYARHLSMEVPHDMTVLDVTPHMHYLAKSVRVEITAPDGVVHDLLEIPAWDFRWQSQYALREPYFVAKGSRIDARYVYDNSAENPNQPVAEPVDVSWGWATTDEMCQLNMTFVAKTPREASSIAKAAYQTYWRTGDVKR
ncbi:MAG: redoxin family protein [Planctomycetota bacterium]